MVKFRTSSMTTMFRAQDHHRTVIFRVYNIIMTTKDHHIQILL